MCATTSDVPQGARHIRASTCDHTRRIARRVGALARGAAARCDGHGRAQIPFRLETDRVVSLARAGLRHGSRPGLQHDDRAVAATNCLDHQALVRSQPTVPARHEELRRLVRFECPVAGIWVGIPVPSIQSISRDSPGFSLIIANTRDSTPHAFNSAKSVREWCQVDVSSFAAQGLDYATRMAHILKTKKYSSISLTDHDT